MKIETHDISLSLEQPDQVLGSLLKTLQNMLSMFKASAPKKMPDYRNILLIDEQNERAQYLAHLLVRAGYRPFIMANALEAFTRFLQVPFVPFTIILSQDDTSNRLFLQRLLQQTFQKYEWEIPLIRLHFQSAPAALQLNTPRPQLPPNVNQNIRPALPQPTQPSAVSNPNLTTPSSPQTPSPSTSRPISANLHPLPLSTPQQVDTQSPAFMPSAQELPSHFPSNGPDVIKKDVRRISLEGQNIGRYHIQTPLGDSSTSNVYKTYDRLREQDVALKALQTDALPYNLMERAMEENHLFQQEADLLRNVDHPHIAPIWNSGKSYVSGVSFTYKTMLYCAEGSLAQWLFKYKKSRLFATYEVAHVILQIADALQYLHDRQIIFQNFKLSNLLLSKPAKNMSQLHLMLIDLAAVQDGSFFPRSVDALPYVAPERWNRQITPAGDQYSLAVIAYELLTGKLPFQGASEHVMKLLHTSMQAQPPSVHNTAIPHSLDSVLLKALSKRPEDRFASVTVFAKTFQKYCL